MTSNESKLGFHNTQDLHFIAPAQGMKSCRLSDHYDQDHIFLQNAHNRLFQVSELEMLNYTVREFKATPNFPSYLYCIFAGPWEYYKSKDSHGDVKLRLFGPKNQTRDLNKIVENWFQFHLFGLKYYENLLGVKYPYSKYDITLAPQLSYSFGACEYPGNVIFEEARIDLNYSGAVYLRNFCLILHEMAHMWFGNLVSLKWWGDLWLKEAFADYMSYLAYSNFCDSDFSFVNKEVPPIPAEVWFAERKTGGMVMDSSKYFRGGLKKKLNMSENQVVLYDKITYGKGFSVLHEVFHLLGGKEFFAKWANYYLETYKNSATCTKDFIHSLSAAMAKNGLPVKMSIEKIVEDHMVMGGLDFLEFNVDYQNNVIDIYQKPSNVGCYRHHYFDIALFGRNGNKLEVIEVNMPDTEHYQVEYTESSVEFEILPNYSNFGYIMYTLSEEQRNFFQLNLTNLDNMAISVVHQYTYLEVLRGKLMIGDYLGIFVLS